ncbi:Suppressor of fused protein (SUFU) [Saccharopolyspora kobensis]|uniref:Suppressor of fused protein (SUFU) n=1 Tax=Saccharopolyspora kobensis TaxID=146035 RepID=A0A1H6E6H4_9PSEU|nr:suppressor of fused domain protein [Saccharopolyspora kobensis]SEG92485.1 Suppressor of fused protein (SUFU) [Saccharopolyspora kobensis]SFD38463.1 Suppressor of fused protein (SUFU) [Saccharopolyspora kobensis]
MSTSQPSPGLLEHLEQRLGPVQQVESAKSDRGNRGYDLAFYRAEESSVSTVVTNGLRFQTITSMMPEELVCSLRSDQQHIAHYLVDSIASMIIRNRTGMEYGSIFQNDQPIIEGTEITAVIAHTSPLFDEAFNLFPNDQAPTLQLISLVPITNAEVEFVENEGADTLFEVFHLNRTDLFDVRRGSAV